MRLDKLTLKAQEALRASQDLARRRSHRRVEPAHLLLALIDQEDGLVFKGA